MRTLPQSRAVIRMMPVLAMLVAWFGGAAHATVYGLDERLLPQARLDSTDESLYSATQPIVCQVGKSGPWAGAGNLVDFTHGVTVAHIFYKNAPKGGFSAKDCRFRVFDRNGKLIDDVAITRFRARWQEPGPRYRSDDLAMFELERRPKGVDHLLSLDPTPISVGQELTLVAFHYDLRPPYTKRKTRGRVYSTLGSRNAGMRNVFNTDVDCVPMSSGGPLYDRQGRFVALIVAGTSRGTDGPQEFDDRREFNMAIRLDELFLREFAEFVRGGARGSGAGR